LHLFASLNADVAIEIQLQHLRFKNNYMKLCYFLIALLAWISSCDSGKQPSLAEYHKADKDSIKTGGTKLIPIETPSGKFNVWTKRVGNNPKIKVLLLHGGPGCSHEYFECFESFFPQEGIEFIYYDQLGSYRSDKPTDTSLWVVSRFVEEVEQVRKALHLDSSNFFLLGHSWGGILAMEYALKYQQHLKGLVISNMMSSCPKYDAYNENVLQKQMDKTIVDSILNFEKTGNTTNPRYMALLNDYYYNKHVCRIVPQPEPLSRMFTHVNNTIYVQMQGPSEFGIAGNLAQWDRTSVLKNIKKPTLVIRGTYDTMDPTFMEMMSKELPKGELVTCIKGSHCSMWDDQENYFPGLIQFLKKHKQ
jgi:proline iminopeptidase